MSQKAEVYITQGQGGTAMFQPPPDPIQEFLDIAKSPDSHADSEGTSVALRDIIGKQFPDIYASQPLHNSSRPDNGEVPHDMIIPNQNIENLTNSYGEPEEAFFRDLKIAQTAKMKSPVHSTICNVSGERQHPFRGNNNQRPHVVADVGQSHVLEGEEEITAAPLRPVDTGTPPRLPKIDREPQVASPQSHEERPLALVPPSDHTHVPPTMIRVQNKQFTDGRYATRNRAAVTKNSVRGQQNFQNHISPGSRNATQGAQIQCYLRQMHPPTTAVQYRSSLSHAPRNIERGQMIGAGKFPSTYEVHHPPILLRNDSVTSPYVEQVSGRGYTPQNQAQMQQNQKLQFSLRSAVSDAASSPKGTHEIVQEDLHTRTVQNPLPRAQLRPNDVPMCRGRATRSYTCRICKSSGHNYLTCPKLKNLSPRSKRREVDRHTITKVRAAHYVCKICNEVGHNSRRHNRKSHALRTRRLGADVTQASPAIDYQDVASTSRDMAPLLHVSVEPPLPPAGIERNTTFYETTSEIMQQPAENYQHQNKIPTEQTMRRSKRSGMSVRSNFEGGREETNRNVNTSTPSTIASQDNNQNDSIFLFPHRNAYTTQQAQEFISTNTDLNPGTQPNYEPSHLRDLPRALRHDIPDTPNYNSQPQAIHIKEVSETGGRLQGNVPCDGANGSGVYQMEPEQVNYAGSRFQSEFPYPNGSSDVQEDEFSVYTESVRVLQEADEKITADLGDFHPRYSRH